MVLEFLKSDIILKTDSSKCSSLWAGPFLEVILKSEIPIVRHIFDVCLQQFLMVNSYMKVTCNWSQPILEPLEEELRYIRNENLTKTQIIRQLKKTNIFHLIRQHKAYQMQRNHVTLV